MSEYWKSTPKYWCKHCKTYVRDTKLEKTNHEATPKHQGNLKRFLRDLHRGHEKDEKDKERAKAEVARLNGMSMGSGSGESSSGFRRGPTPSLPKPQATASQRKQQMAQLAEMGIAIPDEFRPDMAMAGEWQVTSERIIESEGEKKPDAIALGVRKREPGDADEEEIEAKKSRWGSAYRTHPTEEDDGELDALLSNITRRSNAPPPKIEAEEDEKEIKDESRGSGLPVKSLFGELGTDEPETPEKPKIKLEPSGDDLPIPDTVQSLNPTVKQEGEEAALGIVFKKRKAKNIRQK